MPMEPRMKLRGALCMSHTVCTYVRYPYGLPWISDPMFYFYGLCCRAWVIGLGWWILSTVWADRYERVH